MKNPENTNKYLRNALICFAVMVLCCAALVYITHTLFPGETGTEDTQSGTAETVDGLYVVLMRTEGHGDTSDGLFSGTAWGPGTSRTESLAVYNSGNAPLAYEMYLYVINDDENFEVAPDLTVTLSGSHTFETKLADADGRIVALSDKMIQPGETRAFDIRLSLPAKAQKGCDPFSVCLILNARDESGHDICTFTGNRMDFISAAVPEGAEILLDGTEYALFQQRGAVQTGYRFSGKNGTVIELNDAYEYDGIKVYMKDCVFVNTDINTPVGCVFENCDFRADIGMNIITGSTVRFVGCGFDSNVTLYLQNQETGGFAEFQDCDNPPVVMR